MTKTSRESRLLAVDPSLTASGWSLFSVHNAKLLDVGIIVPAGPQVALSKRLEELQEKVSELFRTLKLQAGDYLVCEGPAHLVLNPQSALKLERVRGIFEAVARSLKVSVPGRINPRTVHVEVLGLYGKQARRNDVKKSAQVVCTQLFGTELNSILQNKNVSGRSANKIPQDITDATLIGALCVSKIQICLRSGVEVGEAFFNKRRPASGQKSAAHNAKSNKTKSNGAVVWTEKDLIKLSKRVTVRGYD